MNIGGQIIQQGNPNDFQVGDDSLSATSNIWYNDDENSVKMKLGNTVFTMDIDEGNVMDAFGVDTGIDI